MEGNSFLISVVSVKQLLLALYLCRHAMATTIQRATNRIASKIKWTRRNCPHFLHTRLRPDHIFIGIPQAAKQNTGVSIARSGICTQQAYP
jgi:hypothetical protein